MEETQVKLVGMKTTMSDEKGSRNSIEASEKALFLLEQVFDKRGGGVPRCTEIEKVSCEMGTMNSQQQKGEKEMGEANPEKQLENGL